MQDLRLHPSEEGLVPGLRNQDLHGLHKSVSDVLHSGITSHLFGGERRANGDQKPPHPLRE